MAQKIRNIRKLEILSDHSITWEPGNTFSIMYSAKGREKPLRKSFYKKCLKSTQPTFTAL